MVRTRVYKLAWADGWDQNNNSNSNNLDVCIKIERKENQEAICRLKRSKSLSRVSRDIDINHVKIQRLTKAEYLGCSEAAFEWADSYDSKDWDRLRKCIAPTLRVSDINNPFLSPIHSLTNKPDRLSLIP